MQVTKTYQVPPGDSRQTVRDSFVRELSVREEPPVPYSDYRLVARFLEGDATITQYSSGKLVIQGTIHSGSADQIAAIVARSVAVEKSPAGIAEACIGMDECGKGDYFGPLVVAAVRLEFDAAQRLGNIGVTDSKKIDDGRIPELAERIREESAGDLHIHTIEPKEYNQMYEEFRREGKNLNGMLGMLHARALESVLEKRTCAVAILDKFGPPRHLNSQLGSHGKKVRIRFETKAERHVPVAAASILAREKFLLQMDTLSGKAGMKLPLGASHGVIGAAIRLIEKHNKDALGEFAKLHFKTTQQVLKEQLELG